MAGLTKESLDFLEHYGVKGMRWGVRRGSLGERAVGALSDKNQRKTARYSRMRRKQGATIEERVSRRTVDVTSLGSKRADRRLDKRLGKLSDQRQRIESGRLKARDILDIAGSVAVGDLFISVRDNRG